MASWTWRWWKGVCDGLSLDWNDERTSDAKSGIRQPTISQFYFEHAHGFDSSLVEWWCDINSPSHELSKSDNSSWEGVANSNRLRRALYGELVGGMAEKRVFELRAQPCWLLVRVTWRRAVELELILYRVSAGWAAGSFRKDICISFAMLQPLLSTVDWLGHLPLNTGNSSLAARGGWKDQCLAEATDELRVYRLLMKSAGHWGRCPKHQPSNTPEPDLMLSPRPQAWESAFTTLHLKRGWSCPQSDREASRHHFFL